MEKKNPTIEHQIKLAAMLVDMRSAIQQSIDDYSWSEHSLKELNVCADMLRFCYSNLCDCYDYEHL